MSFVLHSRARAWFGVHESRCFARTTDPASRETAPRFLMFDAYYSCLLLGLDGARQGRSDSLESTVFLNGYPDSYKGQAELIAGLLVEAELRRQDIRPDDRESIEGEMVRLLDLKSATRLSDLGDRLLNLYAAAGFEILDNAVPAPDNLEDFLVAYHRLWGSDV
jgi:hypothetical protein